MITIFTTPKPFVDNIAIIQKNAIRSWRALSPDIQIVIFGDSEGSSLIANEINAEHIVDVKRNQFGTPYISDMFKHAEKLIKNRILCYINADIILPENFIEVVKNVQNIHRFLLIGARWDLNWDTTINFNDSRSVNNFWEYARSHSQKHKVSGIDYFIYSKGIWKDMPDLIAGRAGFDNWLIWRARRSLIPVIDATDELFVVHQNHDYSHHKDGIKGVFSGIEAQENIKHLMVKDRGYLGLNLLDSTHKYVKSKIIAKNKLDDINRLLSRLNKIFPEFSNPIYIVNKIYRRLIK